MKNNFSEYGKPVIVLVLICFVVTSALALTYKAANPKIQERARKDADKARAELLPEADSFDQYDGELLKFEDGSVRVTEFSEASNGEGAVVTVETNSFGGALTMMVGIGKDGEVTGVKVTDHDDTPGVGTKDMTPEYLGQYKGVKELSSEDVKEDNQIDYISGASETGNAIHKGVVIALAQYHQEEEGADAVSSPTKQK